MLKIRINFKKILIVFLVLLGIAGVGLGGWYLGNKLVVKASKVRVTNITGQSATISWVTSQEDTGIVYVKEKDSFLPFGIGSTKGYDDRDFAAAQLAQYNKDILKGKSDLTDGSVTGIGSGSIESVKVTKFGNYYTHHVTIANLNPNTQYYFRIGNGVKTWNVSSVDKTINEFDFPVAEAFSFKTFDDPANLTSPNPAYGRLTTLEKDKDGLLTDNSATDAIVFIKAMKFDGSNGSNLLSSVTNNDGGWTVDKSNLRDSLGKIDNSYEDGVDKLEMSVQFVNLDSKEKRELIWGIDDNPTSDILGYSDENIKESWVQKNIKQIKEKINHVFSLTNLFEKSIYAATSQKICIDYQNCGCKGKPACGLSGPTYSCGDRQCNDGETHATCPGDCAAPATTQPPANTSENDATSDDTETSTSEEKCRDTTRYSGNCNVGAQCYCKNSAGNNVPVDGDCRPALCASAANGDDITYDDSGNYVPRVQTGNSTCNGHPCLCEPSDYKTPGCEKKSSPQTKVEEKSSEETEKGTSAIISGSTACSGVAPVKTRRIDNERFVRKVACVNGKWETTNWVNETGNYCSDDALNPHQDSEDYVTNVSNCCLPGYRCNKYGVWKDSGIWTSHGCDVDNGYDYNYETKKCERLSVVSYINSVVNNLVCAVDEPFKLLSSLGNTICLTEEEAKALNSSNTSDKDICIELTDSNNMRVWVKESTLNSYMPYTIIPNIANSETCTGNALGESIPVLGVSTTSSDYINYYIEPGLYSITSNDDKYVYSVTSKDPTVLYIDRNGTKGYQKPADITNVKDTEDLLINIKAKDIKIEKISKGYDLNLSQGYNIVSFNTFLTTDTKKPLMASDLFKYANVSENNRVLYISYFDGGKWVPGLRLNTITNEILGNDFPLTFGRGYVIKTAKDFKITLPAMAIKESIPVAFSAGWNLIGVNGYTKKFTASSLINSINEISQLTADNVTWWPTSKGKYEGFQKSEGVEYGFDYPISSTLGYFVRISSFNPDDVSNKSVIWNPGGALHGTAGSGE
ncbi:fibronectin type III domain-containing protein [Candidatus Dojkabacteria bacterium]|jgi:hypothetical protein|nr:fibronectin type III domain-containing protein [Candidatus Dojkabacteria bacterium]